MQKKDKNWVKDKKTNHPLPSLSLSVERHIHKWRSPSNPFSTPPINQPTQSSLSLSLNTYSQFKPIFFKQPKHPQPSPSSSPLPRHEAFSFSLSFSLYTHHTHTYIYNSPCSDQTQLGKKETLEEKREEWGNQRRFSGKRMSRRTNTGKVYGRRRRMRSWWGICWTMGRAVGVTLLGMQGFRDVGRVVVFVGLIILDLTLNVELSLLRKKNLLSICIPLLATGPLSLLLESFFLIPNWEFQMSVFWGGNKQRQWWRIISFPTFMKTTSQTCYHMCYFFY